MRRVEPLTDQHREELFALYARIFGAAKAERFRRRFDWQFVRNPFARDGVVTNWVLTSDSKVVGHLGAMPIDIKVGNERLRGTWICDLMVDAPHRFGNEMDILRTSPVDSFELAMGYGMREHVARSYVRLNWTHLAVGSVLVKVLSLRALAGFHEPARRRGRAGRVESLMRRAANVPHLVRQYVRQQLGAGPSTLSGDVAMRSEFDDSFDRRWDRIGSTYPVAVERNCAYLTWRYQIGGRDGARVIALQRAGTLEGFALIEKVRWRGIVVGLVSELIFPRERQDDARSLLTCAERIMRQEGVAAMVTEGFPARVRAVLVRYGFIESGETENAVFFDRLRKCPPALLGDADNWLLTPGDCDRAFAHPRVAWRDE